MSGTYRVEGQTINYTFATPAGYTTSDTIDGDNLIDKDGELWTRKRDGLDSPSRTAQASHMNEPQLPPDEKAKLQAIYDSAPERRRAVDRALSASINPVRVDNNTEAPKLEAILKRAGWTNPTVTEGVKESVVDGYIFKLEVIDGAAEDWYVLMKTDRSITAGTVQSKSKGSPW